MPAMHAILHKALRRFRDVSSYASKGHYDSNGISVINTTGTRCPAAFHLV
jgi:hypothetical protein